MLYLALATIFFGVAIVLVKLSSSQISPLVAAVLFTVSQLVVQLIAVFIAKTKGLVLSTNSVGIKLALLGGVIIGLYTVFLFLSLSKLDITKVTPVVYAGAISISSIIGVIFLGETLGTLNVLGFILTLIGLTLLFIK